MHQLRRARCPSDLSTTFSVWGTKIFRPVFAVLCVSLCPAGLGFAQNPETDQKTILLAAAAESAAVRTVAARAVASQRPAVSALEKLGAKIRMNGDGEATYVDLSRTKINEAELVHVKALTNLTTLLLSSTGITNDGLKQLKGLT